MIFDEVTEHPVNGLFYYFMKILLAQWHSH